MSMNQFLASYYGTGGNSTSSAQPSEDVEKQAQLELFAKLAAKEGIDLDSLSDDGVKSLWDEFQKVASAQPVATTKTAEEEEKKEKEEKAKEEHEEKKAAAEKLAEADFLGRVMAHSYVDELKKIAAAQTGTETEVEQNSEEAKIASNLNRMVKAMDHKRLKDHAGDAKKAIGGAAGRAKELFSGSKLKEHKDKLKNMGGSEHMMHGAAAKDKVKSEAKKVWGARAGAGAAVAGGAAMASHKKEASALDELAGESAVEKAAAAGFDTDEAASRIAAILVLGPSDENSKIAFVQDLPSAVDVRALELLELAGYPVQWDEQK